jgi:hypothetical protein
MSVISAHNPSWLRFTFFSDGIKMEINRPTPIVKRAMIQNEVALSTDASVKKTGIPLYEKVWNRSSRETAKKVEAITMDLNRLDSSYV